MQNDTISCQRFELLISIRLYSRLSLSHLLISLFRRRDATKDNEQPISISRSIATPRVYILPLLAFAQKRSHYHNINIVVQSLFACRVLLIFRIFRHFYYHHNEAFQSKKKKNYIFKKLAMNQQLITYHNFKNYYYY